MFFKVILRTGLFFEISTLIILFHFYVCVIFIFREKNGIRHKL